MEPILRIRQDVRKACAQVAAVKDPDMALLFEQLTGCAQPYIENESSRRESRQ